MSKKRTLLIVGLDEYNLTRKELYGLGETPVQVEAYTRNSPDVYPGRARFRRLLARSPKERRAAVRQWRIRHCDKLRVALSPREFTVLYYNGDPVGVRGWLPARDVRRVFTGDEIQTLRLLRIKGMARERSARKTPEWFAVKARFAKQIEDETKGMQMYEDRILLVKARSPTEAARKAMREFREYEAPTLDVTGHFFRLGFETILDVYDLINSPLDPNGTEVYSEIKTRRMKSAYEWHPACKTR